MTPAIDLTLAIPVQLDAGAFQRLADVTCRESYESYNTHDAHEVFAVMDCAR